MNVFSVGSALYGDPSNGFIVESYVNLRTTASLA